MAHPKYIIAVGQTYGRLTVLLKGKRGFKGQEWICRCSCGGLIETLPSKLGSGALQSCGCLQKELSGRKPTHGRTQTVEFRAWNQMRDRCHNARNKFYDNYGGRGITVCLGWRHSFETFLVDMGERPSDKHSIDRINNNLGYWCGKCDECKELHRELNCRWATRSEQQVNKRNSIYLTFGSETKPLIEWSVICEIPVARIRDRLRMGWTVERALTESNNRERILMTFQGETHAPHTWAEMLGIPVKRIYERLKEGWSDERALGEPRAKR